jgi:hypothetical protein
MLVRKVLQVQEDKVTVEWAGLETARRNPEDACTGDEGTEKSVGKGAVGSAEYVS